MMTASERRSLESMMRVIVSMQGLLDAILFTGQTLLSSADDHTPENVDAPRAAALPQSAGQDENPNDPPRFGRPRAIIPIDSETRSHGERQRQER